MQSTPPATPKPALHIGALGNGLGEDGVGIARQPSSVKEASAGISALRHTPVLIWGLSSCRTCTGSVDEGAAHTIRSFISCAFRRESVLLTYLNLLM